MERLGAQAPAPSFRDVRRLLRDAFPGKALLQNDGPSLEVVSQPTEPARVKPCLVLEDDRLRRHPVIGSPDPGFLAFLDGIQESRALRYFGAAPLVHGRVAAVIRNRVERRMVTWRGSGRTESRLYAPRALLAPDALAQLESIGLPVVDTLAGDERLVLTHPVELLRKAVHAVQHDREVLEQSLAESWCAASVSPLYVDGGLPDGALSASASCCVGVIKSHHTLYAADQDIPTVFALAAGERSSVFVVERRWGSSVASWYLRLRDAEERDPMWGLVRVEVSLTPEHTLGDAAPARANTVSRWILAERSPLSLPDGRWATMAYGIRDCEEYLRATS